MAIAQALVSHVVQATTRGVPVIVEGRSGLRVLRRTSRQRLHSVLTTLPTSHAEKNRAHVTRWSERGFAHAAAVPDAHAHPHSVATSNPTSATAPTPNPGPVPVRGYTRRQHCKLEDLQRRCEKAARIQDYPFATDICQNIVIYDKGLVPTSDSDAAEYFASEMIEVLQSGSGVAIIRGAFDAGVVDTATAVFEGIIEKQHDADDSDQLAGIGATDQVRDGLEKLAVLNPRAFVDYYSNDLLALISRSWLGPGYHMTSQVHVVGAGSPRQAMHRGFHLGVQPLSQIEKFPTHVQASLPMLGLQAEVAHVDVPLDAGPTTFLPFSQTYPQGYLATHTDEFKKYYADHCCQLPLIKGDLVVFNPATFHAAGANATEGTRRVTNLLQLSSPFCRAMEKMDRPQIVKAIYPELQADTLANGVTTAVANAVAAAAEGYPSPTILDIAGVPIRGLTQADVVFTALRELQSADELHSKLVAQSNHLLS